MVVCLDSGDYVQIRNALIVLIRVMPHFPVLAKLAQIIERKIEKVSLSIDQVCCYTSWVCEINQTIFKFDV